MTLHARGQVGDGGVAPLLRLGMAVDALDLEVSRHDLVVEVHGLLGLVTGLHVGGPQGVGSKGRPEHEGESNDHSGDVDSPIEFPGEHGLRSLNNSACWMQAIPLEGKVDSKHQSFPIRTRDISYNK